MSNYAKRMSRLSARIFGEVARPTDEKSMKVVKIFTGQPAHLDPFKVNYYPKHRELRQLMEGLRYHGLFRDEHLDFKEEMARRREARGKVKKVPWHIQKRLEREAAAKQQSQADGAEQQNQTEDAS